MFFRTSIKLTVLLGVLTFIFGNLGLWQLERKAVKQELFDQFENATALPVMEAMEIEEKYALVDAYGHYDSERHILLDNKIEEGRPGVYVFTPFILQNGTSLLVNRGWLPMPADRRSLPDVPTNDSMITIKGRLNSLPSSGPRVGDADALVTDHWPQLVTYLDLIPVSRALDLPLSSWLVQLDATDPSGFGKRKWTAATMGPGIHGAYAFQWFALAAATICIWIVLGIRRGRLLRDSHSKTLSDGKA